MPVALIHPSIVTEHGAKDALARLGYYGYELAVGGTRYNDADVIFDPRCAGWKGWRVHMVEVDERHRKLHDEWRREKALAEKPPVACPIPTADDDDCLT